jgi:hypothetical protein
VLAGVPFNALFPIRCLTTWTAVASGPSPCPALAMRRPDGPLGILGACSRAADGPPGRPQSGRQRHAIDPTDLANSIGAVGSLDPGRGLARTWQQITDAAEQLFSADGPG